MENESILKLNAVSFSYDREKEILHNINLEFEKGKITAIAGANGCGKSTLLNLLAGVLKADRGEISVAGKSVDEIKRQEFAKLVAAVHQQNTAPEDITVQELVQLGRTPYHGLFGAKDAEQDKRAVDEALQSADVAGYAEMPISSLSGGQLQRVWLAMALARKAEILLLDEITTFLDIHYQLKILSLIKKLNRLNGTTVIMVLHDINLAVRYCDNIVLMKDGCVTADLHSDDILSEKMLDNAFDVKTSIIESGNYPYRYYIFNENGADADESAKER